MSGIAKDANLYSVKVAGSDVSGTWKTIIDGLNYVGKAHSENSKK